MPHILKSILIHAPAERVFNLLRDVSRWPEIFRRLINEVLEVTEHQGTICVRWAYKMMGIRLKGESVITESLPNERLSIQIKAITTFRWTLRLHQEGEQTRLISSLEYEIPEKGLGKILKRWSSQGQDQREVELVLQNIKNLVEEPHASSG